MPFLNSFPRFFLRAGVLITVEYVQNIYFTIPIIVIYFLVIVFAFLQMPLLCYNFMCYCCLVCPNVPVLI